MDFSNFQFQIYYDDVNVVCNNDFHTIKVRRKGDEIRAFWGGKDLKKPYSNPKGREDKLDEREVENRNPGASFF